jgi:hypothetical protein
MKLETIYHAEGASTAEFDALMIKGLLEAAGIPSFIIGDAVLPNLPFEVKVPHAYAARAIKLIADHQGTGAARRPKDKA